MTPHASHPVPLTEPLNAATRAGPTLADNLSAPVWTESLVGNRKRDEDLRSACGVRVGPLATLVTVRVRDARRSTDGCFSDLTADAYAEAAGQLRALADLRGHTHVVRVWNFIPGIHDRMDDGQQRYMAFNEGRHRALRGWLGGERGIAERAPAATGVGHAASDLVIHVLAVEHPGRAIENPAQVPAYRYSSRWGRVPPCFARATVLDHLSGAVLVSGTAAVFGEESVFPGDLRAQWDATMTNLGRVLGREPADSVEHARAYVARASDITAVRTLARSSLPASCGIEILQADLCRAELLVEVEAVAGLSAPGVRR